MKINGRHARKGYPLLPENMTGTVRIAEDGVTVVRIDDTANLDFWLEVEISDGEMQKAIEEQHRDQGQAPNDTP